MLSPCPDASPTASGVSRNTSSPGLSARLATRCRPTLGSALISQGRSCQGVSNAAATALSNRSSDVDARPICAICRASASLRSSSKSNSSSLSFMAQIVPRRPCCPRRSCMALRNHGDVAHMKKNDTDDTTCTRKFFTGIRHTARAPPHRRDEEVHRGRGQKTPRQNPRGPRAQDEPKDSRLAKRQEEARWSCDVSPHGSRAYTLQSLGSAHKCVGLLCVRPVACAGRVRIAICRYTCVNTHVSVRERGPPMDCSGTCPAHSEAVRSR